MNTRIRKIMFICAVTMWHMFFADVNILQAQTSNPVGAIPGVIDVSPMGAATYTIPIDVVPGTQGMQPNLSIVYNSMSGMGLLGMKWNLAGLSAITRCGQVPYYDENITSIQISANDRFALNGDRLIRTNNGVYGALDGEYATEIENFTQVTSHGVNVSGHPWYFKAYTDDGSIIEYGNTDDSKQTLKKVNPLTWYIISWYINKITDANGNYMTFYYEQSNDGEIWINEIQYTGNTGIQPYAKVKFSYDSIPAILGKNTYYIGSLGGYGIPQTKLLNSITVSYNNDIARKYQFNYNLNDSGERTAHLKEVVLYGEGGSKQLNATNINWGEQNNNIETNTQSNFSTGSIVTGDFNGDGYADYVVYNMGSGNSRTWKFYQQYPSNNTFNHEGGVGSSLESIAYCCDFDGDEKDELILIEDQKIANYSHLINVYHYDNYAWTKQPLGSVDYFFQAHLGDFTGDGKVNIMYESRKVEGKKIKYTLSFSNNGNLSSAALTFYDVDDIRIVDYNGDGKANIQITKGNNTNIYEYSSTLNTFILMALKDFPTKSSKVVYGDFNGDGITDIINFNFIWLYSYQADEYSWIDVFDSKGSVLFGKGNGNYETSENILTIPYNQWVIEDAFSIIPKYNLYIVDVNGDGKDDIIQALYDSDTQKTTFHIFYSKGYANEK